MTFPCIRDEKLDACLGHKVRVDFRELLATHSHYGTLQEFCKPWDLELMFEFKPEDSTIAPAAVAERSIFPFAGEDGAIVRVTCENRVVYENEAIPEFYVPFDCRRDGDLARLNDLRRSIWGDLYLYESPKTGAG